jgi:capsular exopolysaccharide synthesis family protein
VDSADLHTTSRRQEGALTPYLRAIRAHKFVVAAVTLLALAATVGWLSVREPRYKASAEMLVTPLPSDDRTFLGVQLLRDTNDPTRTAQTAAELVDSPRAAELAAETMGNGYTRSTVQEKILVEPKGQSYVLAVQAEAGDPDEAADLANAFVSGALSARREVLRRQVAAQLAVLQGSTDADDKSRIAGLSSIRDGDDPTLSLSQEAIAPSLREGAPAWLVIALSVIAGFALGAAAAVLMELVNPRIRETDELADAFPMPVLTRVPRMGRRARAQDIFHMPPAVREAYRSLQVQLDQDARGSRVIMLTSASSGDGKTSTAVSLSLALVAAGHRVILMDFDLRKPDIGRTLGVGPSEGLVGMLGTASLEDVLVPAPKLPPLSVAPAGAGEDDFLLLSALIREFDQIMTQARELADYVIIDTSPLGEVSDALRLLPHIDDVIVVARPNNTRRSEFQQVRDLLGRAGVPPLGMVLMGVSSGSSGRYYTYGNVGQARRPSRLALGRRTR